MVGLNEKAQKAASGMRKGHCIIQSRSKGCWKPPADSKQNSGGIQGGKAFGSPTSLSFYVT